MRWRARYYWSALPLSVEQNDETTNQDLPCRLLLADAQNVRSVWHHQANDQQLNPRRTAALRAGSNRGLPPRGVAAGRTVCAAVSPGIVRRLAGRAGAQIGSRRCCVPV